MIIVIGAIPVGLFIYITIMYLLQISGVETYDQLYGGSGHNKFSSYSKETKREYENYNLEAKEAKKKTERLMRERHQIKIAARKRLRDKGKK